MPLVQTRGAASAQGFGEFSQPAAPANYIEDVFSTFLYRGNSDVQTITNGIDLSTKGGLIWTKERSGNYDHSLVDTVRGNTKYIVSSTTSAETTFANAVTSFNTNGFTLGNRFEWNRATFDYVSWTFREQAKFFDIVTYTGNGDADRNIAHNLAAVPGMIIIKKTSGTGNWATAMSLSSTVYAIGGGGTGNGYEFSLNRTDVSYDNPLKSTIATSTTVNVPRVYFNNATICNEAGATYVMYLFASDAGGFGVSGTENVISCGAYSGGAAGNTINVGFEPQFVLIKGYNIAEGWYIADNTRGIFNGNDSVGVGTDPYLETNSSGAEQTATNYIRLTSTGFALENSGNATNNGSYIYTYMAIRRGPMKTPTSGTQVFSPVARSGTGSNATIASGFLADTVIEGNRTSTGAGTKFGTWDRLRKNRYLITNTTAAEVTAGTTLVPANPWDVMDGYKVGTTSTLTNASGNTFINWIFKRAPGFHDVVTYSETANPGTYNHNLGVVPEMMIHKIRNGTGDWPVYHKDIPTSWEYPWPLLNSNLSGGYTPALFPSTPTSTTFTVDYQRGITNRTHVAYLFATVAGVSKVGSYAGTGATQIINCGFTAGARFVLIKRIDSDYTFFGDWFVWDTARGIVSGTDPRLALNNTAAELNNDWVLTTSVGFQVVATDAAVNASGSTYIFLAIA
jgi:hypothetical protein